MLSHDKRWMFGMLSLFNEYKRNLKLFYPYMARHWRAYIVLFVGLFIGVFMTVFYAWFLKNTTDLAIHHHLTELERMVVFGIGITILAAVGNYGISYTRTKTIERMSRDLSVDLYGEIMRLPKNAYDRYHSGDLMARLTNDINTMVNTLGLHLLGFIRAPLTIVSAFIYLFTLNKEISILCVGLGPLVLFVGFFKGKLLRANGRKIQEYYGRVFSFLSESLAGHTVVRSFNLQSLFFERYTRERNNVLALEMKEFRIRGLFGIGSQVASGMIFFTCIGIGGFFISNGSMSVGSLIAFTSLVQQVVGPFRGMSSQLSGLQRSFASAERIWQVFAEPKEQPQAANQIPAFVQSPMGIRFENVTFSYEEDGSASVLRNINLTIPAGKVVALVGPSGAGKSTLLKLIMDFYRPHQGNIYFDWSTGSCATSSTSRHFVSYVPQETYLFSGTIRENLLYGHSDASETELIRAAKDANIHDFISSLPDKYDTTLGENGLRLSGGQKQRLAIARALVKNAPILLFDEATSSLDSEAEVAIREALQKLLKNRTAIVVAHRLSTIQRADFIVVIDKGQIAEQGHHDDLLARQGAYYRLYQMQFSGSSRALRKLNRSFD